MLIYSIVVTVLLILFTGLLVKARRDWTEEASKLRKDLTLERASNVTVYTKCKKVMADYTLLDSKCDRLSASNESLRSEIHLLRGDLAKANGQLRERQAIQAIKFTANVPHIGWTKTEFKLGVGPCGKEVATLEFQELNDRYVITQRCTDGERKTFEYFKVDVSGRIEKAYKAITTH